MSVYRIHFTWNKKDVTLRARGLDLTHPYFVSITEIFFPEDKTIIIDPAEDEIRKRFGKADHLMIPFQQVGLIEEIKDEKKEEPAKVRPFKLVTDDEDDDLVDDEPDDPDSDD